MKKQTGLFRPFTLIILLLFYSSSFLAQVPGKNNDLKIKQSDHIVDVEFYAGQEIGNLMVMMSDSLGNTLFLDSQFRFKGPYKFSMDMKKQPKGNYTLDIFRDEARVQKKIRLD